MYKQDLALNNLQEVIHHKTLPKWKKKRLTLALSLIPQFSGMMVSMKSVALVFAHQTTSSSFHCNLWHAEPTCIIFVHTSNNLNKFWLAWALWEMKTVRFRIWNLVTESTYYDDNRYVPSAPIQQQVITIKKKTGFKSVSTNKRRISEVFQNMKKRFQECFDQ